MPARLRAGEHGAAEAVAASRSRGRTASSASGTRVTVTVGPNVSSRTAADVSGTSTSTVGSTNAPSTPPPVTRPAPGVERVARGARATMPTWAGIVIGPYEAPASDAGADPPGPLR